MNNSKHTMSDLYQMQGMPLDVKVKMTLRRIQEWYEAYNGNVYVSFSGGKDSTVLLDLVRRIYPDMKAVFFNTGIEHPSVIRFVKTIPNTIIIKPKKTFISIIKRYGYPIVRKRMRW